MDLQGQCEQLYKHNQIDFHASLWHGCQTFSCVMWRSVPDTNLESVLQKMKSTLAVSCTQAQQQVEYSSNDSGPT